MKTRYNPYPQTCIDCQGQIIYDRFCQSFGRSKINYGNCSNPDCLN